jgi:hypothetical protein
MKPFLIISSIIFIFISGCGNLDHSHEEYLEKEISGDYGIKKIDYFTTHKLEKAVVIVIYDYDNYTESEITANVKIDVGTYGYAKIQTFNDKVVLKKGSHRVQGLLNTNLNTDIHTVEILDVTYQIPTPNSDES